jgi:Ran GTPase-activating protein (RanGAP) involved in mRNA processing and transport
MVRNVDLSYNEISDIGIEMLAKTLKECHPLESVNLQGNSIGTAGA